MSVFNDLFKPLLSTYPLSMISSIRVAEHQVLYSVILFMWLENIWQMYLSLRQHRVLNTVDQVPVELEKSLSKEDFEKCRSYALDNSTYGLIKSQIEMIVNTAVMFWKVHFLLWALAGSLCQWLGLPLDSYELCHTYVFMFLNSLIDVVLGTPFRVYKIFVIEEKHGFNQQSFGFFVKDEIKKFIIQQLLSLPVLGGIIYIIKIGGDYFFLYAWLFVTVMLLIMLTIYPSFIAPLFDKYTPLPEGELKVQVEALASRLDFPLKKLFVVEGSKRSAHSNAYIYGLLNNKRIVLYDTLIKGYTPSDDKYKKDDGDDEKKQEADEESKIISEERKEKDGTKAEKEARGCTNEEIVAVIGHELGHWKYGHFWKGLVILEINTLFAFIVFANLFRFPTLFHAFGFHDSQPVIIGLVVVLGYILMPYKTILNFLMSVYSRHREYEADFFAKKLGLAKPLGDGLVKLMSDNLSFPVYDKWYSAWHHSHPTVIERLRALSKED